MLLLVAEAAFALLAVSCNLFPTELYEKKGGKKLVKESFIKTCNSSVYSH